MARRPRKATAHSLENAALAYLGRFASSAENLRRVLMRRVERSARVHGTDRGEGAAIVAALIERYQRAGLLNDAAYAEGRAASLHRRGLALGRIGARLAEKGVAREDIAAALAKLAECAPDVELAAALHLARRRRLGPYRRPEERAAKRERDLAAMGRAGFSYDLARRVIDAETAEQIELTACQRPCQAQN